MWAASNSAQSTLKKGIAWVLLFFSSIVAKERYQPGVSDYLIIGGLCPIPPRVRPQQFALLFLVGFPSIEIINFVWFASEAAVLTYQALSTIHFPASTKRSSQPSELGLPLGASLLIRNLGRHRDPRQLDAFPPLLIVYISTSKGRNSAGRLSFAA